MPPPIVNFEGVNSRNGVYPPDTEGAIGPNHYMQWVNLSFAIYNRSGGLVYGPADGYTFFDELPVCGTPLANGGDPVVLYDQLRTGGSRRSSRTRTSRSGRSTSASRSRRRTIRPGSGVSTRSWRTRRG
jgi:hypothetical protein